MCVTCKSARVSVCVRVDMWCCMSWGGVHERVCGGCTTVCVCMCVCCVCAVCVCAVCCVCVLCVCVCVCVCVCGVERERERECVCVCVCVCRKRRGGEGLNLSGALTVTARSFNPGTVSSIFTLVPVSLRMVLTTSPPCVSGRGELASRPPIKTGDSGVLFPLVPVNTHANTHTHTFPITEPERSCGHTSLMMIGRPCCCCAAHPCFPPLALFPSPPPSTCVFETDGSTGPTCLH